MLAQRNFKLALVEKIADFNWPAAVKTKIIENSSSHDKLRQIGPYHQTTQIKNKHWK
jgi:hypothetical protein